MEQKIDKGFIYVIRQEFSPKGIYKVGKTKNMKSTLRAYQRQGNVIQDHIEIPNHLGYVEALILNICAPYRTLRPDNRKISEQVQLPFKLIVAIVKWVYKRVIKHGKEINYLPVCRSIKTIGDHRKKIPLKVWHLLCDYLDKFHSGIVNVPMDISVDEEQDEKSKMSCKDFDHFVLKYVQLGDKIYTES